MDDNEDSKALRRALEAVIDDALTMGWGRVVSAAERAASLWVTDPEDGARDPLFAHRDVPEAKRTQMH